MFFLTALYMVVANFAHPVTPTFIQNLGLHDYMFGVAFAAMSIGYFLLSPFWGKLSKEIGSVKIMTIGYIGYGICQYFFGISSTEVTITIARLFAGFFVGAVLVNEMLYIMENSEKMNVGSNLAKLAAISAVFGPVGYLVGGFIGDISVAATFNIQAISLILSGVLCFLILEDKPREETVDIKKAIKEGNPFKNIVEVKTIMNQAIFVFFLMVIVLNFSRVSFDQSFNYFIKDQFNFLPSYNGILKAIVGITSLVVNSTLTIWLVKKTDTHKSFLSIIIITAVLLVPTIFINDMVPFVIVSISVLGVMAIYLPIQQNMLAGFKTENQGLLVGAFNSVKALGNVLGALTAGFVYGVGPRLAFVSALVALLIGAVFAIINKKQIKNKPEYLS